MFSQSFELLSVRMLFSSVVVVAALSNLMTCLGQNQNLNWTLIDDTNGIVTSTSQYGTIGSDSSGQYLVLANAKSIVTSDDYGDFLNLVCCSKY